MAAARFVCVCVVVVVCVCVCVVLVIVLVCVCVCLLRMFGYQLFFQYCICSHVNIGIEQGTN